MKRRQLFEFEDLAWFPRTIRNYMTDFLRTVAEKFNLFGGAVPILSKLLQANHHKHIIDLASGGGGQWRTLVPKLRQTTGDFRLTLTDRYPNLTALGLVRDAYPELIEIETGSVDATNVPSRLQGVRTMFLSLHHFSPESATEILADAVKTDAPIAVFEAQQRDLKHLIQFFLSPLMVLLITPLIRPFSPGRFLFTYLIPIVPLAVGWDGLVSVLRTYTPQEMAQMAQDADPTDKFMWEVDVISRGQQKIQYLVGNRGKSRRSERA